MNSMVRERGSHAVPLYIAVTPEIRRALEMLAEASISLLDEIERPTEGLEDVGDDEPGLGWTTTARGVLVPGDNTDDREFDDSDLEEDDPGEDDGTAEDAGDHEGDLGWTELGEGGGFYGDEEVDFLPPEASGVFSRPDYEQTVSTFEQKAAFKAAPRRSGPLFRPYMADELFRIRRLLRERATARKRRATKIRT